METWTVSAEGLISLERAQTGFTWELAVGQTPVRGKAAPQRGEVSKGGVLELRHQLASAGLHGNKQHQIQPCCITTGGSPKLLPLITMQEFTATDLLCAGVYRKGPPWL